MENNEIIEQTAEVATTVAEQVKKPGFLKETAYAVGSWIPYGAGACLGAVTVLGTGLLVRKAVAKLVPKLRDCKAKKEKLKKSKNNDDNVDVGEMPETID